LAYENGIRDIADPLGGSYLLETLTKKLEQEAHNYFNTIDSLGGMIPAIEKGFPQKEIQEASYQYQKTIEKGDQTIVGVNEFLTEDKMPIEVLQIDSRVQEHQSKRLKNLRRHRNSRDVHNALSDIKQTAVSRKNLIPSLIQAAKVYVTVGEMVEVLKETLGIYQEPSF
jgi:methylmalonyl-CoA mutase N-terminal domain/subunit